MSSTLRRVRRAQQEQIEFDLHVISNTPTDIKAEILRSFYIGAIQNRLGYMDALDIRTNTIRPILVGIEPGVDGQQPSLYPLAFLMNEEDSAFLKTPDGQGNYISVSAMPISH